MSIEYVLQPLPGLEKSSNDFLGAFIYMMRYRGMELMENEVQLPYAGIRLSLSCQRKIYLKANFMQGIHQFCTEKQIQFQEWEISSKHLKQSVHDRLTCDGAFMMALSSGDFDYFHSFVSENVPHCITVTGIDEEGLHIADACPYPGHEEVYQGILPFSSIQEMEDECQIWVASVEGDYGGKKRKWKLKPDKVFEQAKQNYIRENVALEPGSRLRTGYDYCEYLYGNMSELKGHCLREIADNIMAESHVPQLRLARRMFAGEPEYFYRLSKLSNDWMLLLYHFVRQSIDLSFTGQDVLIENYRALLGRERDIYESVR